MVKWLSRIFRKKQNLIVDESANIEELWETGFSMEKNRRFIEETEDGYTAFFEKQGFSLQLKRKNIFAWTLNPLYEYKDFVLETLFDFSAITDVQNIKAGLCAFGFLFRYINDSNYYLFLLSNRGFVRLDAVFNGNPLTVLGWTKLADEQSPIMDSSKVTVRLIARGIGFTVLLNDRWLAYVEDDTIQSYGKIAYAGQNWNETETVMCTLHSFSLDSRPGSIEAQYYIWNSRDLISAQARINLAESYYASHKFVPALIEIQRAEKNEKPLLKSLLLAEKMYMAQHLYEDAEKKIAEAFGLCKTENQIIPCELFEDYASLLYMQNRFEELDTFFLSKDSDIVKTNYVHNSALLSNICAHILFQKNEFEKSLFYYKRSFELDGTEGLYAANMAQAQEVLGLHTDALESRLRACRLFLAQEKYTDMTDLIPLMIRQVPDNTEVLSLAGKLYYALDDFERAFSIFEKVCVRDSDSSEEKEDSAVWFLCGILRAQKNMRTKATQAFQRAADLEPLYPLYQLRLTESLFLSDSPHVVLHDHIQKCIELDSQNGWVWNLAFQIAMKEEQYTEAEEYILKALSLLSGQDSLLVNLAQVYSATKRIDEAFILYDRILQKNPKEIQALTGKAELLIEQDKLNEADVCACTALDIESSVRLYEIIGLIAQKKGEFARAEITYRTALQEFSGNIEILFDLCNMYMNMRRFESAQTVLSDIMRLETSLRSAALKDELCNAVSRKISCSSCNKMWYVPHILPPQAPLHLTAEPPDDLPAGSCPECGMTYCIACAKKNIGSDGRFKCPSCAANGNNYSLKLFDKGVSYLLSQWISNI